MEVTTATGKVAKRANCAYIGGKYYIIGDPEIKDSGERYPMETGDGEIKRYRIETGKIDWNHYVGRYQFSFMLKTAILPDGTIGSTSGPIELSSGYFVDDDRRIVEYPVTETNDDVGFWCTETGHYYVTYNGKPSNVLRENMSRNNRARYTIFGGTQRGTYNIEDVPGNLLASVEKEADKPKLLRNGVEQVYTALRGLNLGAEFETSKGIIPEPWLMRYGMIPLRDGSINGVEYTSIVVNSLNRFNNLFEFLIKGRPYMAVDRTTSMHLHFSIPGLTAPLDIKKFALSLYMLYYHLQNELEFMVPLYKRSREHSDNNNKDYCKSLPNLRLYYNDLRENPDNIDEWFNPIFRLFNDGQPLTRTSNLVTRHPAQDTVKYNRQGRYAALNMFNLFFKRSHTVEFRLHHGTVNSDKIVSWILICAAIVNFAKDNYEQIVVQKYKFNLDDIIRNIYSDNEFMVGYLISYINVRRNQFEDSYFKNEAFGQEFNRDGAFEHKYGNQKLIE